MSSVIKFSKTGPTLIGITGCRKTIDDQEFDATQNRNIAAIEEACEAVPLIVPTLGDRLDRQALLSRIDGLLFTGSPSNVEPHHYRGPASEPGTLHDPHRDATTLPLIRQAVAAAVPVFCICRGFQELNVAYGGTLHQNVQELSGMTNHRADPDQTADAKFAPIHEVELQPGGVIAGLCGTSTAMVNSLHSQGIDTLADGLQIEATSPDGLIEAVRVTGSETFALAVQWHPEWRVMENAFYLSMFSAFAEACRARLAMR